MELKTKTALTIIGVVAVVAGAYWLINRKNTLGFTGASGAAPAGATNVLPGGQAAGGNQVYTSQGNVILRSSAQVNDPTWGIFGGNVNLTIDNAGTWIGTLVTVVPDINGAINPVTNKVYNWYQVTLSQTQATNFSLPAGSIEFVREDFVTVR